MAGLGLIWSGHPFRRQRRSSVLALWSMTDPRPCQCGDVGGRDEPGQSPAMTNEDEWISREAASQASCCVLARKGSIQVMPSLKSDGPGLHALTPGFRPGRIGGDLTA
jgi:hypothetical protein